MIYPRSDGMSCDISDTFSSEPHVLTELPCSPSDTPPLLTPTALAPEAPFATSTKNPMTDSHPASLTSAGSRPSNGSSISTTEDTNALLSSLPALDGTRSSGSEADNATASDSGHPRDVDPQIVEALRGKDRIYVLKLGEMLESLINEERR